MQFARKGCVINVICQRSEAFFVWVDLGREGHAQQSAPMKGLIKGNDGGALSVGAGNFNGIFYCLGTGCEKGGLFIPRARDAFIELFCQADVVLIGHHLIGSMGEALELCLYGSYDFGVAVAGVEYGNAAAKVDMTIALLVPELGILGPVGKKIT